MSILHSKFFNLRWHLSESPYRIFERSHEQMNIVMFQHGLEDFVATDHVSHHFDLDRTHEAYKHGAISQSVQGARLREQYFEHFHEDLVIEEVDPEAALNDFLVLFRLWRIKYILKD